jgi:hypothetical protein
MERKNLNMSPSSFINNVIDSCFSCIIFLSKFATRQIFCFYSYISNLFFIKFRSSMSDSFKPAVTSFFTHINSIIFLCSKKKMIWSYTTRIITFVKNFEIFGYFPKMKLPRNTMSTCRSIFKRKFSITKTFTTNPFPTFMKWNNKDLVPESFFRCFHKMSYNTGGGI